MNKMIKLITGRILPVIFLGAPTLSLAQSSPGEIHGSFQIDGQYYIQDSTISAPEVAEKYLLNGYGDLVFTKGNFKAGVRSLSKYFSATSGALIVES